MSVTVLGNDGGVTRLLHILKHPTMLVARTSILGKSVKDEHPEKQ